MELSLTVSGQKCTKNAKIWGLEINGLIGPVLQHATAAEFLGRGGCVSTILAHILPEHCDLVSSFPSFSSGGRGLKSWTRNLLSWLRTFIVSRKRCQSVPHIWLLPALSTSFPVHYLLLILPLGPI
jgi:hypothetical protein